MAYFLLAKSNFVSNQETKYQGRKGFSDPFFSGYYVNISLQCTCLGKQHMNGAVLKPCIVVGVSLFYCDHCDLEELLTAEKCLADVLSK